MANKTKIYTVSEVNSLIKAILENNLPSQFIIAGEITNWSIARSGHVYFDLKDENALLLCVMWKSTFSKVKFEPENGMAVIAKGHIDVYTAGGKYQFYVERIEPAGVGALQLAFEQMVKKLEAEGLFKDEYKKPLPPYPQRIGILTSESGAAVEDIRDSIHSRWPCVELFLYPVPVQGEGAAEEIAAAVRNINRRNQKLKLDILIVGRGGGSMEDLWAFNEEVLARAIFDSVIPVISAVGHEVDTTIADLVADKRASTPTKAGIVAVPDFREALEQLKAKENRLNDDIKAKLKFSRQKLETILASAAFRNPLLPVQYATQQLDEAESRLANSTKTLLAGMQERLRFFYEQVVKIEPHRLLKNKTLRLNDLKNRVNTAVKNIINKAHIQLTAQASRLAGLNPKAVFKRGYSITTNKKNGILVRSPDDIEIGDAMITELAEENLIESKVTKK